MARGKTHLLALLALVGLAGCAPRGAGGRGDDDDSAAGDDDAGPDDDDGFDVVDLVLLVDGSNSMGGVQDQLRSEFPAVIDAIRAAGVDFRLAVTSTDLDNPGNGRQGNLRSLDPMGGGACQPPDVLHPAWDEENPGLAMADAFGALVDVGTDGSGTEYGLYAAALALCKGMPAAFWEGFGKLPDGDPVRAICGLVPEAERDCNAGVFREGAATVVVAVSDEGDMSFGLDQFPPPDLMTACELEHSGDPAWGECDCRLSGFLDFFAALGRPVHFVTVAPTYQEWDEEQPAVLCDGSELVYPGPCNPYAASLCALDFYQQAACLTGGFFEPIEVRDEPPVVDGQPNPDSTCYVADFGAIAGRLAAFLTGGS